MKAKCKCGHVFVVKPEEEGKTMNCPGCGRRVRMPVSPERPKEPGPERKPEREGAAFDWEEEFSLEGEEEAAPAPGRPEPAERPDLRFEAGEFELEAGAEAPEGGEAPIEIGADQIVSVREGVAAGAPAAAPAEEMKVCRECGRVVTEQVAKCPECGTQLAHQMAPDWRGSFWGAFPYSYAAVMVGDGWKAWLNYALIGAVVPLVLLYIAPLTCLLCPVVVLLALAIMFGSVIGGMYLYMARSAAHGVTPMQEVKPKIMADMVTPFLLVLCSSSVLVFGPFVAGSVIAKVTGAANVVELFGKMKGIESVLDLVQIVGALLSAGAILAGLLIGLFCFPMVVMLLGASQRVGKSVNPINVFRALFKAPLEYPVLWLFFMLNFVVTPIIVTVVQLTISSVVQGFMANMVLAFVSIAIWIYMFSVNGWRMGMFLHRHPRVFDHVQ